MSDRKLRVFVIWTVVEQKKRPDDVTLGFVMNIYID